MTTYVAITMRCAAKGDHFRAIFQWSESRQEYVFFEAVPLAPLSDGQSGCAGMKAKCASGKPREAIEAFDLSEFDFHGFVCPSCGKGRENSPFTQGISYVECGRCGELVCGARVDDVQGTLKFRCHKGCGGNGKVVIRPITTSGISGGSSPTAPLMASTPALGHGKVAVPPSLSLSALSSKELSL